MKRVRETLGMISSAGILIASGYAGAVVLGGCTTNQTATQPTAVSHSPVYNCDKLVATPFVGSDDQFDLDPLFQAEYGAAFRSVTYNLGNGEVDKVSGYPPVLDVTYSNPGTYLVKAVIDFDVNGQDKYAACTKTITVS